MESFDQVIHEFKRKEIIEVHLVTTLSVDVNLQRKVNALHSFCKSCTAMGIKCSVYEDGELHGKVYIGLHNGVYECGMLTSANFTNKGLKDNHEWGIWIDDKEILKSLHDEVFNVCSEPLTSDDISGIVKKVDDYFTRKPVIEQPKIELSIKEFIRRKKIRIPQKNKLLHPESRYVIKPVGSSADPFVDGRKPDEITHVSDRYVKYVNEGAILIYYGIGAAKFLGCFEVIAPPERTGRYKEWPWEVKTKNLFPEYSDNWERSEKAFSRVKREYPSEIKSMNKIQWQWGAIPISEDFGSYLINSIEKDSQL